MSRRSIKIIVSDERGRTQYHEYSGRMTTDGNKTLGPTDEAIKLTHETILALCGLAHKAAKGGEPR